MPKSITKSKIRRGKGNAGAANLKPAKPGEVRNPNGVNGATKRRALFTSVGLDVMGRPVQTSAGEINGDEAIWLAMRNKAIKGDVQAATWIRDTLYGKPAQTLAGDPDRPLGITVAGLIATQGGGE